MEAVIAGSLRAWSAAQHRDTAVTALRALAAVQPGCAATAAAAAPTTTGHKPIAAASAAGTPVEGTLEDYVRMAEDAGPLTQLPYPPLPPAYMHYDRARMGVVASMAVSVIRWLHAARDHVGDARAALTVERAIRFRALTVDWRALAFLADEAAVRAALDSGALTPRHLHARVQQMDWTWRLLCRGGRPSDILVTGCRGSARKDAPRSRTTCAAGRREEPFLTLVLTVDCCSPLTNVGEPEAGATRQQHFCMLSAWYREAPDYDLHDSHAVNLPPDAEVAESLAHWRVGPDAELAAACALAPDGVTTVVHHGGLGTTVEEEEAVEATLRFQAAGLPGQLRVAFTAHPDTTGWKATPFLQTRGAPPHPPLSL